MKHTRLGKHGHSPTVLLARSGSSAPPWTRPAPAPTPPGSPGGAPPPLPAPTAGCGAERAPRTRGWSRRSCRSPRRCCGACSGLAVWGRGRGRKGAGRLGRGRARAGRPANGLPPLPPLGSRPPRRDPSSSSSTLLDGFGTRPLNKQKQMKIRQTSQTKETNKGKSEQTGTLSLGSVGRLA